MGFFSNLGDVLSGKTLQYNSLIGNDTRKLLERAKELPSTKFLKDWVSACILSTDAIMDTLLFSGNKENEFKKNISKIDAAQSYEIRKILASSHLLAFINRKDNDKLFKKFNINIDTLQKEVFMVFMFSENDKNLFQEAQGNEHNLLDQVYKKAFKTNTQPSLELSLEIVSICGDSFERVFKKALEQMLKGKL
ncbi:MAG: hypothetical protein US07_C0005G0004 [Candidatus Levybacteria bacterium GW2011_GWB1_36_18]|nr:MAG: hypothetical protein US07_C0005G0004 [Candidatus Levybacteria bacterium GW2011_GWB1_36_18]